jgi:hypothetical protein
LGKRTIYEIKRPDLCPGGRAGPGTEPGCNLTFYCVARIWVQRFHGGSPRG